MSSTRLDKAGIIAALVDGAELLLTEPYWDARRVARAWLAWPSGERVEANRRSADAVLARRNGSITGPVRHIRDTVGGKVYGLRAVIQPHEQKGVTHE